MRDGEKERKRERTIAQREGEKGSEEEKERRKERKIVWREREIERLYGEKEKK